MSDYCETVVDQQERLSELDEVYDELLALTDTIDTVREKRWEAAKELLCGIQSELETDEQYPIMRVNQHTRGGTTRYVETLTVDGVMAVPDVDSGKNEAEIYITSSCPTDGLAVAEYTDALNHAAGSNTIIEGLLQENEELPVMQREYY